MKRSDAFYKRLHTLFNQSDFTHYDQYARHLFGQDLMGLFYNRKFREDQLKDNFMAETCLLFDVAYPSKFFKGSRSPGLTTMAKFHPASSPHHNIN